MFRWCSYDVACKHAGPSRAYETDVLRLRSINHMTATVAVGLVPTHIGSDSAHTPGLIVEVMRADDVSDIPSGSSLGSVTPTTNASFDMADTTSGGGSDHGPTEHQTFYIREDMVKIQVHSNTLCPSLHEADPGSCRSRILSSGSRSTSLPVTRPTVRDSVCTRHEVDLSLDSESERELNYVPVRDTK
jgi:hypothetical protein